MKKFFMLTAAALLGVMTCSAATLSAPGDDNLLKSSNWRAPYKGKMTMQENSCMCENADVKDMNGISTGAILNQTEAKPIKFSAESKAENVSGSPAAHQYGIYLDITHADGSKSWGKSVAFKTGTHDWEKAEMTYTPEKPIKSVNYYLLFRGKTGKVEFRNATLHEVK